MIHQFHRSTTRWHLALAAAVVGLACQSHAAISVGPNGSGTLTFATAPPDTQFTTGVLNGTGPTYEDVTALDAGVAGVNAANIVRTLPTDTAATPGTFSGGMRWNSALLVLQSRPTTDGTNAAGMLLAKLQNNTGADAPKLAITYDFAMQSAASGALPGFYVYYSLSGAPGTWTRIPALSGSETAARVTATVDLTGTPWLTGATMYVLWVDDNANGITDPSYTIDNLVFEVPVLRPVAITQQPVGTNVVKFRPFSLSVQVTGTDPQFQWYQDTVAVPGATSAVYSVAQAQLTNTGDYYVIVANTSNSVQSTTVHVEVLDDNIPPTVIQAVGSATFNQVTIQFSEKLDPASLTDTANFALDPGAFSPTSILLTNADRVVVLTFSDLQTPDTDYTLTMSFVTDLAGNSIPDNTVVTFHSWVPNHLGGVVFQVYTGLSTSDNSIGQLTNNVNYPYKPAETYFLNGFNTREAYPDDSHEGYGGRLRSVFVPLVTGSYRFFTYSDDSSYVYLNPAGPDPAGASLIAYEAACCNPFAEPGVGNTRTSDPIPLTAGHGYYIEAIYKEGTGGDYCYVAARLEGDPTPASALTNIMSSAAAAPALPAGLVGAVVISNQPAAATVEQPASATFTVVAGCTPAGPLLYQWQKSDDGGANWAAVPRAAGPSYSTGPTLRASDDQDQYRVVVKSPGGEATSDAAILTVNPDITGPTVVSVSRAPDLTTLLITFSEPVDVTLGTDPTLYTVCNTYDSADCLDILSGVVELTNNNTQAYLITSMPNPSTIYRVTVLSDMTDAYGNNIRYPDFAIVGVETSFQNGNANGYAAARDIELRSDTPTTSRAGAVFINIDQSDGSPAGPVQGMLMFGDIFGERPGQVPPGSVINSATLSLTSTEANSQSAGTISLYLVLTNWTEQTATWASVGNGFTPDDTRITRQVFGTIQPSFGGANPPPEGISVNVDVTSSVRAWYTGPRTNLGWALISDSTDGYRFNSSETNNLTWRPKLTVGFTSSGQTNPVVIVTQPTRTNIIDEGQSITLSVSVAGTQPAYQWYKDDNLIPSATGPSYAITGAVAGNSGKYYCRISNLANSLQSSDSFLTVIPDLVAPTVVSVNGGLDPTTITVTFSKEVSAATAQSTANYSIAPGLAISSAVLSSPTTVTLTTAARTLGTLYTVTIKDIRDTRANQNLLSPNPTVRSLIYEHSLLAFTDAWRYEQSGTDLGTAWIAPGYNDSLWPSGAGVLGLETSANTLTFLRSIAPPNGTNTVLSLTNLSGGTNATIYFRTTFNNPFADLSGICIRLRAYIDDGAVWYLNGIEAGRYNMPSGPITYSTFASGALTEPTPVPQATFITTSLNGLVPGLNHFAAEVHQDALTSSDLDWGAEIIATIGQTLTSSHLSVALNPNGTVTLDWTDGGTLQEAPEVTGPWVNSSTQTKPQTRAASGAARFFRVWACQ